jgi:fructoselysine-6-P-deglycase FrlB-like protein
MISITEKEIFAQYAALQKTFDYFSVNSDRIRGFYRKHKPKSLAFIGCGSSLCQCRSAELSAKMRLGIPAISIAGGDLMLNYPHYKRLLKGALLVAPSRSGATSEVVISIKKIKRDLKAPAICICAREKSELSEIADLTLAIPWAFDQSVCQTRSVTNIYAADLCLAAAMAGDKNFFKEIGLAVRNGPAFMAANKHALKKIGSQSWDHAVVLADSELEGIGGLGALSIKEIAQTHANYYHILDVRHGPIVFLNKKTLVIIACPRSGTDYQKDLVRDLKKRGATVVTVSSKTKQDLGSDLNIAVPPYKNLGVMGIPFIFVPQLISFHKAVTRGLNPDVPRGLDPWIVLKEKK